LQARVRADQLGEAIGVVPEAGRDALRAVGEPFCTAEV
jgi:hypothetical protein